MFVFSHQFSISIYVFLYNKISMFSLCTQLPLQQLFFIYCSLVVLVLPRVYFQVLLNILDIFFLFLSAFLNTHPGSRAMESHRVDSVYRTHDGVVWNI